MRGAGGRLADAVPGLQGRAPVRVVREALFVSGREGGRGADQGRDTQGERSGAPRGH